MTACAAGKYQANKLATSESDCLTCPAQSYSNKAASSECKECGSSSRSDAGATECSCTGNNRKFLADEKICVCIDRFESATPSNSQIDSSEDCSRKLVSTCPDTSDTKGNCVSTTESCYDTCGTHGGTRVLGMCDCAAKTLTDSVCPESCRSTRNSMYFSATGDIFIQAYDNSTNVTQSMSSLSVAGSAIYSTTEDNNIVSIGLSSSTFTANYEASSKLAGECTSCNAARRMLDDEHRSLASTGTVNNPVICISQGDILFFDVDSTTPSYPVYVTASLLNTNPNFDYGAFLSLASSITSGTTVNYFMHQFDTSGIYVFENSNDNTQQMVVAVMGTSQKCPDSSEYISPISMKSMLLVGAAEADVVYEPDWVFIICLLVGIMILIGFMIGVYYYLRRSWSTKLRRKVKYRKVNLKGEILPSIRADNRCFEFMQMNRDQRVANRVKQKMNREVRYSEVEDIRQKLKRHLATLKGDLFWDGGGDGDNLTFQQANIDRDNLMLQLEKLKNLIIDHKRNIEGDFDGVISDEDDEPGSPLKKRGISLQLLSNNLIAAKKMDNDIIADGNKHDEDELNKMMLQIQKRKAGIDKNLEAEYQKQANDIKRRLANLGEDGDEDTRKKLMDELKEKLDRIDNNLKDEENAQMLALEDKLAQRKKRRANIVDDYAKLQQEKEELNDNSYIRKEIEKKIEEEYHEKQSGSGQGQTIERQPETQARLPEQRVGQ